MIDTRAAGRGGEEAAAGYLINKGYRILYRNFRYGRYGEVDIIAKQADVLCFVEVKSRTNVRYGLASESVGHKKRVKILAVASHFLKINGLGDQKTRFDILEIYYNKTNPVDGRREINKIRHIENAFGAE